MNNLKNDFSYAKIRWWNILEIVLAVMAFWMPAKDGKIDFNITRFLNNEAGLTFFMVMPIIMSSLLLFEKINNNFLYKISVTGIYYGILNVITWFVLNKDYWWMGIFHLPLLINSIIAYIIVNKQPQSKLCGISYFVI
jgi:hypothetical protein